MKTLAWLGLLGVCLGAPTVVAQEDRLAEAWPAGEARALVFRRETREFAWTWSRRVGPVEGGHAFEFRLEFDGSRVGRPDSRTAARLETDARGRPRRMEIAVESAGELVTTEVEVSGGRLTGRRLAGAAGEPPLALGIEAEVDGGAFALASNLLGLLEILFAVEGVPEEGERSHRFVDPGKGEAIDYLVEAAAVEAVDGEPCRVVTDSFGERLWVGAGGRIRRCELGGGKIVLAPSDAPWPDREVRRLAFVSPAPPAVEGVEHVEVRVPAGGVELAGTLSRPAGRTEPLPAIVFLSGSGPHDRRARVLGIDLGTRRFLDRLARRVAVLHLDDRGVGESTGVFARADLDDLVGDAEAAVRWLRSRPGIDPDRIALAGHSEGGTIAPIVAARDVRLAGIALLAGTGRPMDQVVLDQIAYLASLKPGVTPAGVEFERAAFRKAFEELRAGGSPASLRRLFSNLEWIRDHVEHDPVATIRRVRCPVLLLQGGKDYQVDADKDAGALLAALEAAGHGDHELRVFPDLDHLFQPIEGRSTPDSYKIPRPVAEEMIEALDAWTARVLEGR